jgi:energy-converting hydrogenase A subunit M
MSTNRINLADEIPKLEEALGVEDGFFSKLSEEDDWSMIIKLHSLIEAAISELLAKRLKKDILVDAFSNMELSNKKSGKMAFVKALDLLDEPERRYISSLSELRNKLVHNVQNVNYQMHEEIE